VSATEYAAAKKAIAIALGNELEVLIAEQGMQEADAATSLGWSKGKLQRSIAGHGKWTFGNMLDVADVFSDDAVEELTRLVGIADSARQRLIKVGVTK